MKIIFIFYSEKVASDIEFKHNGTVHREDAYHYKAELRYVSRKTFQFQYLFLFFCSRN